MQEQIQNTFEQKLIDTGFQILFHTSSEDNYENVWKDGENEQKLKSIVSGKNSSLLGRFLASEVLLRNNVEIDQKYNDILSESYVFALEKTNMDADDFIGVSANSWGFLYNHDSAGHLGEQLINYGEVAVPHLVKLLEIKGIVLYEGSQEATIGNEYQYRIKDFAAFYISKIKNIPMTFYQDFDQRDAEIERLKDILANK